MQTKFLLKIFLWKITDRLFCCKNVSWLGDAFSRARYMAQLQSIQLKDAKFQLACATSIRESKSLQLARCGFSPSNCFRGILPPNPGTATVNEFHSFRRGSSDYSVNNMPLIYFNQRGFFPCQFTTIILHAFISATSLSLSLFL